MHPHPAHDRGMVGDARLGPDLGFGVGNNHAIVQIVLMGVDVGVIRDGGTLVDDDFTAIDRNRQNSFPLSCPVPSTMFVGMDIAARTI